MNAGSDFIHGNGRGKSVEKIVVRERHVDSGHAVSPILVRACLAVHHDVRAIANWIRRRARM